MCPFFSVQKGHIRSSSCQTDVLLYSFAEPQQSVNGYSVYVEPQAVSLLDHSVEGNREERGAPENSVTLDPYDQEPLLLQLQAEGNAAVAPPQQPAAFNQDPHHQWQMLMQDASLPFDDVFTGAPFRGGNADVFSSAPFPQPHVKPPHPSCAPPQPDVFLQAPFGKRTAANPANTTTNITTAPEAPPSLHPSQPVHLPPQTRMHHPHRTPEQSPLVGPMPPHPHHQSLGVGVGVGMGAPVRLLRCSEVPLPQQPVAAHRVISSVGQQAAVGSVPVGPLHSWTVGVGMRVPVADPFMAAPFHPRGMQGKP